MERMKELLDRLDYMVPGMEEAGRLYREGNLEGAMKAVAEYFRTHTSPAYLFDAEEMETFQDDEILAEAQEVMDHKIYGHQFPGKIEWDFNPTMDTSRDNERGWSLFRRIYWQPLARAYALTGDEKYTREFLHQMEGSGVHWPAEPFVEDETFETRFQYPGHAWRTIETAMRVYTSWLPCMKAFRRSEIWGSEEWVQFLTRLYDHGGFLMDHYSNHSRSGSWLTMESDTLLQCGVMFPEVGSQWRSTEYRRVMHEVECSFDNGGTHMERTPTYHIMAAGVCLQCMQLCGRDNVPIAPCAIPTSEKSARFLLGLVKPDFSIPMIGDVDRNDLLDRRCDTSLYEGVNLTFGPKDMNEMQAYFNTVYEITSEEDFLWLTIGREEGKALAQRSFRYADADIYVTRTGWEAGDSYFHVHGIQLERGEKSTHSHNDTGHVELHIRGEGTLADNGRYIYSSPCQKELRHYFLSAKAHNTLYVDGHGMGIVPGVSRVWGVRTYCHAFKENDNYQMIDVSHNGYVYTDDPTYRRRRVLRLEQDVFIVDDQVTELGLEEHDIRLYFNFAFSHLTSRGHGEFLYESQKERLYRLENKSTAPAEYEILEGNKEPLGGWVSYGYAWRKPIPQLAVKIKGPAPVRFFTMIRPQGISVKTQVGLDTISLKLESGNAVILGKDKANVEEGGIEG